MVRRNPKDEDQELLLRRATLAQKSARELAQPMSGPKSGGPAGVQDGSGVWRRYGITNLDATNNFYTRPGPKG